MIRTTAPSNPSNSVAAVFAQHSGAEKAVKELKDGGFDVKKLSIVGSDYHSEENVVGFYNAGDRMMYWGSFLGRTLGPAVWIGVLPDPWFRTYPRGRSGCHLDYRRAGRRSSGRRGQRVGSRAVQSGHSEGHHFEV